MERKSKKNKKEDDSNVKADESIKNEKCCKAKESDKKECDSNKEVENLKKQVDELKERELRSIAEFDNFRKRTQREKEELFKSATADCLLPLLAVVDNLERALSSSEEESEFKNGVNMILTQFQEELEKLGVTPIESEGETFDPNKHNAVNTVEDKNFSENTICQVFQKGYMIDDKVLRHAMVVVANP